jgi:hypothetical protein
MRKLALLVLLGACALTIGAPIAFAEGAEVTKEVVRDQTAVLDFTNPCTGDEGTATIAFHSVLRLTLRPNNTVSVTSNVNGTFLLVPDDPTAPTSSGRFVSTDVFAGGANDVETTVLTAHGNTADGAQFRLHFLTHLTETGTGVTLTFDRCS